MLRLVSLLSLLLLVSACAGTPDYTKYGASAVTPQRISMQPQLAAGKAVLWGGLIMKTVNLKDRTQVEVLAYPLDGSERPQIDQQSLGRFIFEKPGYLEPASYTRQRQVTVVGTVTGTLPGRVGNADYNYPVVSVSQHTLWPRYRRYDRNNTQFGIGVGTDGSWGGVGIGF